MADGWSELGAMLGGGSQLKQQAYQAGLETGARQASLLEQARQRRDANLAMQAITPQAIQGASSSVDPVTRQPYDPDVRAQMQSELVANMFRAGIDPRQLTGAQLEQQQLGGLQSAGAAMQGLGYTPEQAAAGAALINANGGKNIDDSIQGMMRLQLPVAGTTHVPQAPDSLMHALGMHTTAISGGQAYNPMGSPDQDIQVTPVGQAAIGAQNALAGERGAHARLLNTQSAAGGFNPNTGGGGAAGVGDALLTPEALALNAAAMSHGYAIPLPSFGIGAQGAKAKAAALNQLAQAFKDQGIAPEDAVSGMIQGKTGMSGLSGVQKTAANINAWENSASKQADIALGLSDQVDRTGVPLFNKWLNAGRQGTGDPAVAQFNNATATLAEEYARVMGGGNAQATDSTRSLAHSMLNSAMTKDQFNAVVGTMKREMATRRQALQDSVDQTRGSLVHSNAPTASPAAMGLSSPGSAHAPIYHTGQVINIAGKAYRVAGGDPSDPDLVPL